MSQGLAFFMILVMAYGVFGLVCSFTCAKVTFSKAESGWQKTASVVVFINISLTIIGFLARMISG